MRLVCWAAVVLLMASVSASAQPPNPTPPIPPASQAEVDQLKAEVQRLKDAKDDLLVKLAGPIVATIAILVSALVSYLIFVWHARDKEQRQRAVEMLQDFMTSENFVKARLIIQEYLLPTGSKYKLSLDEHGLLLNFNKLNIVLGSLKDTEKEDHAEDREARFYLRAIPSFFWLVDQAKRKGYIAEEESLFNFHYAWYWTYIIRFRIKGCQDNRLFQCLDWMLKGNEASEVASEYDRYVESLPSAERAAWVSASNAAKV